MGNKNSGRRPQPTPLKVLRGTLRSNRTNKREPIPPRPPDAFDVPPTELDGDHVAIAEWARVVPMMRRIGLVSETDRAALVAMCQQWARYIDAHDHVRTGGMVIEGEKGPFVSPYVSIMKDTLAACKSLLLECGCTPSSRSKTHALPDEPKQSKWAGLL